MGLDETTKLECSGYHSESENSVETRTHGQETSYFSKLKNTVYRRKVLHTACICWAFVMLGFIVGQRGPSFLDLQIITQTDIEKASTFFTATSVGYLVGSLLMGVLYDRFSKPFVLFLSIFLMGITVGFIPFSSYYLLMTGMCFLNGVFLGAVDTGGNAELFRVWGGDGRHFMMAIHFSFSFGGTISPIITEPFLAPKKLENAEQNMSINHDLSQIVNTSFSFPFSESSFNKTKYSINISADTNTSDVRNLDPLAPPETKIYIAFWIGAFLTITAAVPFFVMFLRNRVRVKKRDPGVEIKDQRRLSKPMFAVTIFLLCLFFMLYSAAEETFAAYLLAFTVNGLDWSKSNGSLVTSAYWAAFSIARFLGIFFINCLTSAKILSLCCFSLILSLLAFLISAHLNFVPGIWIGAVIVGLSMSVIFPTAFTWAQEELIQVTGKVSAAILCSSSAGTMMNPVILGFLMQQYTPMWYCYILFADSIACISIFLLLLLLSRKCIRRKNKPGSVEFELNVTK